MSASAGLRFRAACPGDAQAIATLHADSWQRHYRGAFSDAFLNHNARYAKNTVNFRWHFREDFIFDEDLMYLYDEFLTPGKKSSGSWAHRAPFRPSYDDLSDMSGGWRMADGGWRMAGDRWRAV